MTRIIKKFCPYQIALSLTNGDIPDDGSIWIIAKYNKEEKELIRFEAEIDSNKHAKGLIERLNELFPEND